MRAYSNDDACTWSARIERRCNAGGEWARGRDGRRGIVYRGRTIAGPGSIDTSSPSIAHEYETNTTLFRSLTVFSLGRGQVF